MSSINIEPLDGYISPEIKFTIVDFPEPVEPYSNNFFDGISKLKFFKTKLFEPLNLKLTLEKIIFIF